MKINLKKIKRDYKIKKMKKSLSQSYYLNPISKNILDSSLLKERTIPKKTLQKNRVLMSEKTNKNENTTSRNFFPSFNISKSKSQYNIKESKISQLNINNKTGRLFHFQNKKIKNKSSSKMTVFERMCNDIDKIKKKVDITMFLLKKNEKYTSNTIFLKNTTFNNNKIYSLKNEEKKSDNISNNDNNEEELESEKEVDLLINEEKKIAKIPLISLSTISTNSEFSYKPLFKKNININNNQIFHERKFMLSEKEIIKKTENIYRIPNFLKNSIYKVHDPNIQMATISDKINLLLDNISYFKTKYMYNGVFLQTFDNLEGILKAEFNIKIEEICFILVKITPILLTKFYDSLEQILYIPIPDFEEELKKKYISEKECLNLNYKFLNNVCNYFNGCTEIFRVLKKKIEGYKFSNKEYYNLNVHLDLARYDTSSLITFSKNFIDKIQNDQKILNKFEENVKIKKKEVNKEKEDEIERYHKRQKKIIFAENLKIERINNALDVATNFFAEDNININNNKNKIKLKEQQSILNSKLLNSVLKYIDSTKRKKIIAQRVVERYRENEFERMKEDY